MNFAPRTRSTERLQHIGHKKNQCEVHLWLIKNYPTTLISETLIDGVTVPPTKFLWCRVNV